jgi:AmmeMemoRadiSam system protein A
MMPDLPIIADALTEEEKQTLLRLAREALTQGVNGRQLLPLDLSTLTQHLRENGASFVTLTEQGELRGCIGTLEPYQPLAEDVREHAVAAAINDYRFPPVRSQEVSHIQIEISRLTLPNELIYQDPQELLKRLRPNIDGVVLRDGIRRATFLPQVWEKLPDPELFLTYLCQKMGMNGDRWRKRPLQVFTYQVEEFHE